MIKDVGMAVGRAVAERAGRVWSRFHEASPLAADLLESEDSYLVVFDAPGATHSDVQVRYVDGEVLVRVDRFRDFHEGFEMVFPGRGMSLDGRTALPDGAVVDPDAAEAHLRPDGTLEVWVPKDEPDDEEPGAEAAERESAREDERVGTGGIEGEDTRDEAIEAGR